MLLALKPPSLMQHDIKPSPHLSHIHEYSTSSHSYKPASNTPTFSRYSPPESPRHLPSFFTNGITTTPVSTEPAMSGSSGHGHSYTHQLPPTSSHHRGLPPPSATGFSLPPPTPTSTDPQYRPSSVAPPPPAPSAPPPSHHHGPSPTAHLGQLPAPPSSWSTAASNHDESMRNWLHAKMEEDRRKQEEERTRQETLRLDRRRMERDMLRESLERGVPPAMVPLIFAGIGSGSDAGVSQAMEFAQTWMQNFSLQQQQVQNPGASDSHRLTYEEQLRQQGRMISSASSPDLRREREQREVRDRMIPPNPYASTQAPPPSTVQRSSFSTAGPPGGALSKLNTVDFAPPSHRQQLHPSLSAGNLSLRSDRDELPTGGPSASSATANSGQGSGAGLFFHHWTPPTGTSTSQQQQQQPPTPSGKSVQGSPFGSQGSNTGGTTTGTGTHGHLRKQGGITSTSHDTTWENSPKKRKTTHQTGSGSSGGSGAGIERGGGPGIAITGSSTFKSTQQQQHGPSSSSVLPQHEEEGGSESGSNGRDTDRERERDRDRDRDRDREREKEREGTAASASGGGGGGGGGGTTGSSREPLRPSSRQLRREELQQQSQSQSHHHQHHQLQHQHQQGGGDREEEL